jgi:hypothetical protein
MESQSLRDLQTLKRTAKAVQSRLRRKGLQINWGLIQEHLKTYEILDDDAAAAAVDYFSSQLTGTAAQKVVSTTLFEDDDDQILISDDLDSDAATELALEPGKSELATNSRQEQLVAATAQKMGVAIEGSAVTKIAQEIQEQYSSTVSESTLIQQAIIKWVKLQEQQAAAKIQEIQNELVSEVTASHGRLATQVRAGFANLNQVLSESKKAQDTEIAGVKSFFANIGLQIE